MRKRASAAAGTLLFLVVAPGSVAGLIPWTLTRWQPGGARLLPLQVIGGLLLFAGAGVLLHAFARFVWEGIGTPAPMAPTDKLVVGGLYRFVRNPMYIAVVAAVLGEALLLARPILIGYGVFVALAQAAFVRVYEEPTLRRRFGVQYDRYCENVPAWLPRLRPWREDGGVGG
jgi:protein-S-isoprenylcysteine O-methyltransferase Ste14